MDLNRTIITKSAKETQELGKTVAHSVKRGEAPRIVCLYGNLGSGKTTFVQGFAQGMGLTDTRLLSPTFIIVRRYDLLGGAKFFYHIDLYRMEHERELRALGLLEIVADANSYVAVEWAERLGNLLPARRLDIRFRALANEQHEIVMKAV